jgi:hypothetical protein
VIVNTAGGVASGGSLVGNEPMPGECGNKKGRIASGDSPFGGNTESAAVAGRPAAAATAGSEVNGAIQAEPVIDKVDFNGGRFFQERFIDHVSEPFHVKAFVCISRLVQSHCQRRTASSTFVQENPNGLDFFILEIISDHLCRCLCDFNHVAPPCDVAPDERAKDLRTKIAP